MRIQQQLDLRESLGRDGKAHLVSYPGVGAICEASISGLIAPKGTERCRECLRQCPMWL